MKYVGKEGLKVNGDLIVGDNTISPDTVTFDGTTSVGARIKNINGYVSITPLNTGWAHLYSDRARFIFNKPVDSIANAFSSYNNDLLLQRNRVTKLTLGDTVSVFGTEVKAITFKNNSDVEVSYDGHKHAKNEITDFPTSMPANGGFADGLMIEDTRDIDSPPSSYFNDGRRFKWEFKRRTTVGSPPVSASASSTYAFILTVTGWSDSSGGYPVQISVGGTNLAIRQGISTNAWGNWSVIANIDDIPTKVSQLVNDSGFLTSLPVHNHDTSYEPKNTNIQTHIGSTTNPHGTTKSHVGLGSVLNYGLATQAEAEAGTSNVKYMTPLRTKQTIDKYTPTKLSQFENDIGAGAGLNIVASPTEPSINPGDWWYKEI